jgi:mutator protein MutT
MDESHEIHPIMVQKVTQRFQYCPKCSSDTFKSEDGGRSFLCEACAFHYYINNSAAVACLIINASGELLLTRRAYEPNMGMIDLPGGFVEPMESAEEAVVREIKEELNLEVVKMSYLISFPNLYPFSNIVVPTADLAFVCEVKDLNTLKPDDDVASVEFIHPSKINLDALCAESMKQIIQYYITKYSM